MKKEAAYRITFFRILVVVCLVLGIGAAILFLAMHHNQADSATYYVDCSSDTNGIGTLSSPWNSLDTINVTTEVKEVSQDFQGVSLNALLNLAGLKDGASQLVITASDGYSSDVNLSDVQDCPYAMVAFLDTPGTYMIVLPDLATSTWVKNVVHIEVK